MTTLDVSELNSNVFFESLAGFRVTFGMLRTQFEVAIAQLTQQSLYAAQRILDVELLVDDALDVRGVKDADLTVRTGPFIEGHAAIGVDPD